MKMNPGTIPHRIKKYNGKSIFSTFLNTDQNAPKKIWASNYIALYYKTASNTEIGPQEVPQPENA